MSITRVFTLLLLTIFLAACSSPESEFINDDLPLGDQIDLMIEADQYEAALNRLSQEDRDDPEVLLQLEKTHLNYALHSMTTFDQTEMRTRMNNALAQFTEVLRINPNNIVAREQIEQILAIYQTFPNRAPDPAVMEGLREFGYE